jgi:hypothetical protein
MKKNLNRSSNDEMRSEYDLKGGVRGKYYQRYKEGTNVVLLEPDIAKVFRDSKTVNQTLRQHLSEEKKLGSEGSQAVGVDELQFDAIKRPPASEKIVRASDKAKALSVWISQHIDWMKIPGDDRSRLATGWLHLALEHHDAVIHLTDYSAYGSAFALLRLCLESHVRASWLLYCATERDLTSLKKDKVSKSVKQLKELIDDLEKQPGFSNRVFSESTHQWWRLLNSLTHSGFAQVVRHTTEALETNYPEDEIVAALNFVNVLALISTIGLATIAQNEQLLEECLKKAEEYASE